jgi:hypothetical protein
MDTSASSPADAAAAAFDDDKPPIVNSSPPIGGVVPMDPPPPPDAVPSVKVSERRRMRYQDTTDGHVLQSIAKGQSDIEKLAKAMEERKNNRMVVTFSERKEFLDICYKVAKTEGGSPSRFSKAGLQALIDEYQEKVSKKQHSTSSGFYKFYNALLNLLGFWDMDKSMLELLRAGMVYLENGDEDEFYYRDFNFYSMTIESRFSFMRIPQFAVAFWLLVYYFGSVLLFWYVIIIHWLRVRCFSQSQKFTDTPGHVSNFLFLKKFHHENQGCMRRLSLFLRWMDVIDLLCICDNVHSWIWRSLPCQRASMARLHWDRVYAGLYYGRSLRLQHGSQFDVWWDFRHRHACLVGKQQ